jgi:hypothetical protein
VGVQEPPHNTEGLPLFSRGAVRFFSSDFSVARLDVMFAYIRAAAGIGGACGLGASPTPDPREPARDVPTYT